MGVLKEDELAGVQVHYVLIPAADLEQEGAAAITAFDVYAASLQTSGSRLSDDAHACGQVSVPAAQENFTLTLAPSADTAECREYSNASKNDLGSWASTQRCSRCPVLHSETRYQVRVHVTWTLLLFEPERLSVLRGNTFMPCHCFKVSTLCFLILVVKAHVLLGAQCQLTVFSVVFALG